MSNRGVIPSTAAIPGRDCSSCQLTEKTVSRWKGWRGALTVPFHSCFTVLVVQQLQPAAVEAADGSSQQGWEEQEACPGPPGPLQDRLHSLAEAERLLDELTQEKTQVTAVVS